MYDSVYCWFFFFVRLKIHKPTMPIYCYYYYTLWIPTNLFSFFGELNMRVLFTHRQYWCCLEAASLASASTTGKLVVILFLSIFYYCYFCSVSLLLGLTVCIGLLFSASQCIVVCRVWVSNEHLRIISSRLFARVNFCDHFYYVESSAY